MIVKSESILPGEDVGMLAPHSPSRLAIRVDMDPPTAAAFTVEDVKRLEAHEVAELAPEYQGRDVRGVWLRVRNHSNRPATFRAQITLGPDTSVTQSSAEQALERYRRQRRDAKPD